MMGLVFRTAMLGLAATCIGAAAQPLKPPVESVTVTGTRSREVLDKFVASFAAPTRMTGKLARWEDKICPVTVGLRPAATKFVTQRVKEVAAKVGAPVNDKESCRPNITIEFTTTPQALLDTVRKKHASFLGYYDNSDQLEKLATVTRPIQSWYATATKDMFGATEPDKAAKNGIGLQIARDGEPGKFIYPNATAAHVTGSHLGDGLRSVFYNVIIIADRTKLADYEIGSIADYISILALTQLNAPDTCQQLPSIVNMLAAGCERKANAGMDNDLAYLRGLYKMSPDRTLRTQQNEMAYQMEQTLGGK
jgi:hypothetical protein